mgnify:CR=1 FL=1
MWVCGVNVDELDDIIEYIWGHISDEDEFGWLLDGDGSLDVVVGGWLVMEVMYIFGECGLGGGGVDDGDGDINFV